MKRFLPFLFLALCLSWLSAGEAIPGVPDTPAVTAPAAAPDAMTTPISATAEVPAVPAAPEAKPAAKAAPAAGILAAIFAWLNSSSGVAVIGGIIVALLGKLFTAKPEWRVVYDKYLPLMMQAVKLAEKAIPDGSPNVGLARLDWALQRVIQMEPALAKLDAGVLKQALNFAHLGAEAGGNL